MEAAGALSPVHDHGHGPGANGAAVALPEPEASSARERIARAVELPPERRPRASTLTALAAAAGVAAVVLGALALVAALEDGSDTASEGAARDARQAIALLSKPSTERIPFAGSAGTLVLAVGSGGRGVLVLRGLVPAPAGKTYEAWVVGPAGGAPDPDALFSGSERIVSLTRPVPEGATVAVTVEDAVGADTPTQRLRLVARRGG